MYVDKGGIVERGNHEELMAKRANITACRWRRRVETVFWGLLVFILTMADGRKGEGLSAGVVCRDKFVAWVKGIVGGCGLSA